LAYKFLVKGKLPTGWVIGWQSCILVQLRCFKISLIGSINLELKLYKLYSQLWLWFQVFLWRTVSCWTLWLIRRWLLEIHFIITYDFCGESSCFQVEIWPLRNYSSSTLWKSQLKLVKAKRKSADKKEEKR
jgi:hypothetical protein